MFFKQLFDPTTSTYTYLIADDETHEAVLIDPVIEQLERDLKLVREHGLTLKYILETHVHADHITASLALKQATGAQTAVSLDCNAQGYDRMLEEGNVILFGREECININNNLNIPMTNRIQEAVTANLVGGAGLAESDFVRMQVASDPGALLRSVSAQQLAVLAGSGKLHILDVRTPGEFASLRIAGS